MTLTTSLEPTAALVMDLARKFYNGEDLTSRFLKYLDLSSGQKMIDDYKSAGIYELTQELIGNRKFIIRHAVLEAIQQATGQSQVVILASGKAPLALELLTRECQRIDKIYEVDAASLEQKKAIYKEMAPELCEKVAFLQTDIRSPELLKNLDSAGLDPALNTVIVLEGITHYMTSQELEQTLEHLREIGSKALKVVIDFGPPYESLTERIQPTAREAYRIIEDNCYLKPMTKHTADGLAQVFRAVNGEVLHHYTIHDIEKIRTGQNQLFPENKSGWLEYMVARIGAK